MSDATNSTVVQVKSASELAAALAVATAGETIQLAAGTYSNVSLSGLSFATPVTITSQSASTPAIIAGLKLSNVKGLNFTNIELSTVGAADPYYGFRIQGSSDVNFSNLTVQGYLGLPASQNLSAFYLNDCSNVSVSNSSFANIWAGVTTSGSKNVTISNNTFTNTANFVQSSAGDVVVNTNNTNVLANPADSSAASTTQTGTTSGSTSPTTSTTLDSQTSTTTTSANGTLASTTSTSAGTIVVKSVTELYAALKTAQAGETIQLASGNYANISLTGLRFSAPVTITSADPANLAVISGLRLSSDSNITFSNLEMTNVGVTDPYYAFRVSDSSNLSFSDVQVQGNLSLTPGQNISAFYFAADSNISVTNSTFNDLWGGITNSGSTGLLITGNEFNDVNTPVQSGSGATLLNNTYTNIGSQAVNTSKPLPAPPPPSTAPTAQSVPTTVVVSSVSSLQAALKSAQAGETIELATGNYSGLSLSGLNFSAPVTITSQSAANPAVLAGLTLSNDSNLTFSNLEMTNVGVSDPYYAFRISGSSNLAFTGIQVHGNLSLTPSQNISGFYLSGDSGVAITNSTFNDMWGGVTATDSTGVAISGDVFKNINTPVQASGGVTQLSNTFTNIGATATLAPAAALVVTPVTPVTPVVTPSAPSTPSTGSTTVVVNSVSGLYAALGAAQAGETIEMAGGQYSGVYLSGLKFASGVTITSQNASDPAIFEGITLNNDSNLNFKNVEFSTAGTSDPYYGFRVYSSSNISFSHTHIEGNPAIATPENISGFYLNDTTNVSFTDSIFENLASGITANYNSNLSVTNDVFTAMNKGGVEIGAATGLNVSSNTFTNFDTADGTHADAVQLYTSGLTTPSSNVVIDNNLFYRGSGMESQGFFVGDEVGTLPVNNLEISGNTIIGGNWNSIYVDGAIGKISINNNTAASWAGYDPGSGSTTNFGAWLRLTDLSQTNLTETGNLFQSYLDGQNAVHAPAGNGTLGAPTDSGLAMLETWASTHQSQLTLQPANVLSALGLSSVHSIAGIV